MYNARERLAQREWIEELERAADALSLSEDARSTAIDLFLSDVPESDRSKRAVVASSLYAGSLIAGDGRTQGAVAEAMEVSRLSIQSRWKAQLEAAGLEPPSW
ncbi:transcription initiation factor IIB family protein [Halovivax cerinus]|uniref:Transcription initiation factor IIB family protein n=1 Tax=Halovivax cerinus TaxID=1487865 RepID=A0ABD5NMB4_9EURY|nr:transcription initiation factor IIB family protein [Halovivax cerinus]